MNPRQRKIARIIAIIRKAQQLADKMELTLGNGAEVGGILGGTADDLEQQIQA